MTEQEKEQRIAELTAQVTPFDAFHALHFGITTQDGARYLELYAQVRELRGDKIERIHDKNGAMVDIRITPKRVAPKN